jgi:hypothetical protein
LLGFVTRISRPCTSIDVAGVAMEEPRYLPGAVRLDIRTYVRVS